MQWLHENHPYYTLLSNGLAPSKVIDAVRQYKPVRLYISLDGDKESYPGVRGVDGHDKVIELIETLKDEIPISLMFCLTPWNSFADMDYVIGIAKKYGIDVRIGIYGTMDFFDTKAELLDVEDYRSKIPASIHDTDENYDFVALYDRAHLSESGCEPRQHPREYPGRDIQRQSGASYAVQIFQRVQRLLDKLPPQI